MSLRQASAGVLRRIRYRSHSIPSNSLTGNSIPPLIPGKRNFSSQFDSQGHSWRERCRYGFPYIFLCGSSVILGANFSPVMADDSSVELKSGDDVTGFRKIEDGSVVSNEHTSKWRVFTNSGIDFFLQGKLDDAEPLFRAALEEAKKGFGERDPHVASSCNNLADVYRIRKIFDKAESLYLEAINILEESYGPDDIRVGAVLHNLGIFYIVQMKLENARVSYERALKIKRRILGENHVDYADTMYRLGTLLHLQGKDTDSEALILDSIRILENGGQGESVTCITRLHYLAQLYIRSNRPTYAENILMKILNMTELSKVWNSSDTVFVVEEIALLLMILENLRESKELFIRCLDARKRLHPADHIQIAASKFFIAKLNIQISYRLKTRSITEAISELESAKDLLLDTIRISRHVLDDKERNQDFFDIAVKILLQSFSYLTILELIKAMIQEEEQETYWVDAIRQCISTYKQYGSISNSPRVEEVYLLGLKHLLAIVRESSREVKRKFLQEFEDEIRRIAQPPNSSRTRYKIRISL